MVGLTHRCIALPVPSASGTVKLRSAMPRLTRLKGCRVGSIDDSRSARAIPPGPRAVSEAFHWPRKKLQLVRKDPARQARLQEVLKGGVVADLGFNGTDEDHGRAVNFDPAPLQVCCFLAQKRDWPG